MNALSLLAFALCQANPADGSGTDSSPSGGLNFLPIVLIVVIFLFTDWSAATSIAVCSPIVILFCYWSLPRFMALWVGIEYLTDVTNDEPWIRD